jgi:hypothetical protein
VQPGSHWDFLAPGDLKLRAWLAGNPKEQAISAIGIGYTVEAKVPCLIRRVTGNRAQFATAYDLSGKGDAVTAFTASEKGIEIQTPRGKQIITFTEAGANFRVEH